MMLARWEALAELMATALVDSHPEEKAWRSFVVTTPNKAAIKEFVKDEKMVAIGPISSSTTAFLSSVNTFCTETHIELIRRWYTKETEEGKGQSLEAMASAQTDAKLALAVATAAKALHLKLPKATDRKDKQAIADKTKQHIDKAILGKAHAFALRVWLCVCI